MVGFTKQRFSSSAERRTPDGRHDAEGAVARQPLHDLVQEHGRGHDAGAGERGAAVHGGEEGGGERDLHFSSSFSSKLAGGWWW